MAPKKRDERPDDDLDAADPVTDDTDTDEVPADDVEDAAEAEDSGDADETGADEKGADETDTDETAPEDVEQADDDAAAAGESTAAAKRGDAKKSAKAAAAKDAAKSGTKTATKTGTKTDTKSKPQARAAKPPKRDGFTHRLYTGEAGIDFVGKRNVTFVVSAALVLASIALLVFKGLNFGIDFVGGNTFEVPASPSQVAQAEAVVQKGLDEATAEAQQEDPQAPTGEIASTQTVGTGDGTSILIKTTEVSPASATAIAQALAEEFRPEIEKRLEASGTPVTDESVLAQVSNQAIDATWGGDVSRKALIALGVFLIAVSIFLRFRYRGGLVVGAMIALLHDLIVSIGIYALVGFEVTPATVIGMLTILGFSLYDTVVVFDKVDENTKPLLAGSRMTYSEAANLAINQTLMRSINTSVISLLPIVALLFVGAGLLGAGTLKDLSLVLMVGVIAGVYSSVFLAAPIAADIAERRPEYQDLARRVTARRSAGKDKNVVRAGRRTSKAKAGPAGAATSTASRTLVEDDPEPPRNVGTTPKPGAKPVRKGKR